MAQEPFFMDSATQPSRGLTSIRVLGVYRDTEQKDYYRMRLKGAYGLRSDLALLGEWGGRINDEEGMESAMLRLKWRFSQYDFGPVNTLRAGLLAGTEIPAGSIDDDNEGWNPTVSAVTTAILGRHGINAEVGYRLVTPGGHTYDNEARVDASYLYRLHPVRYNANTLASWYAVSEWNSRVRGGSDYELLWTVGLLYEAWRWAAELGVTMPLAQDVETLEETHWGIVAGMRTLF